MGNDDDHELAAIARHTLAREQAPQQGNAGQAGDAGHLFGILLVNQAAEKVDFAFVHANIVLHLALSDDGLIDAAEIDVTGDGGNIEVDVHRDVAILMDVRQKLDVDADVDKVELRIDQRVDAHAPDAGLEAAGGSRLALADLQGGFHSVDRAELRGLQDLCLSVGQRQLQKSAGQGD